MMAQGAFVKLVKRQGHARCFFNVAGIIQLKDRIRIRAPYITIAGNTAPGDGVCIAGNTVELETHDIIIRHMRFRRGATDAGDRNDSFGGNPIGNLIIDHVSASWGLDENMSMYRHMYRPPNGNTDLKLPTVNITIQNSIFSEALNTYHHAFGSTIGGLNSTFHHNLWACNTGRNPSVGMYGDFTFTNNVRSTSTIATEPSTAVITEATSTSSTTISSQAQARHSQLSPTAYSSLNPNVVRQSLTTSAKPMWQATSSKAIPQSPKITGQVVFNPTRKPTLLLFYPKSGSTNLSRTPN